MKLIFSCGRRAADFRQCLEWGRIKYQMTKVWPGDLDGSYGDYIFDIPEDSAVRAIGIVARLRADRFVRVAR